LRINTNVLCEPHPQISGEKSPRSTLMDIRHQLPIKFMPEPIPTISQPSLSGLLVTQPERAENIMTTGFIPRQDKQSGKIHGRELTNPDIV